ncbi:restriction endonuclease subunit S [Aeromonas bestiarum]|uniref:restriction endonuclease subunit S n=1 Tax=Aeromonas bestiarum TaxID=105751 RepID=UPI0015E17334|nr:restriction endonuclease subunit S [Aeromonas bestiarum]
MVNDLALKNIPDGWQTSTLGEYLDSVGGSIQTGPFGSQLHASDYVEKGVPSVMPKNILVEGINQDDIARINEADVTRLSKYRLAAGDIIYSRRGDVEKCSLVTELESGWLCGTGCLRVRLGQSSSKVTPEFLHAYLSSPIIREWISRNAIGATMPNLNTGILRDVPFIIPDAHHAVFIGKSWKSTNNKITLNRQINQTLEQMAQALFKSWFVDFDPVVDNALDAGFFEQDLAFPDELLRRAEARRAVREHGDFKQLPDATRQLFPTAFEECAEPSLGLGGWVPQGWMVQTCEEVSKKIGMGPFGSNIKTSTFVGHGVPIINGKQLSGFILDDEFSNFITPEHAVKLFSSMVCAGDIVLTHRGTIGQVSIIPKTGDFDKYIVSQSQFFLRPDTKKLGKNYLLLFLRSAAGQQSLLSNSAQVGVPAIARPSSHLKQLKLIVPTDFVQEKFENLTDGYINSICLRKSALKTLAKLRDTLLPKLISGELRLDKIEAQFAKEGVA